MTPTRVVGTIVATAALALLVYAAVPFWALPRCANDVLTEVASPDGTRKAVIFDRDCGATTPFSTQVSLLAAAATLADTDANLFVAEDALGDAGPRVAVTWDDATRMTVQYEAKAHVLKAEAQLGDLTIRYVPVTVEDEDESPGGPLRHGAALQAQRALLAAGAAAMLRGR